MLHYNRSVLLLLYSVPQRASYFFFCICVSTFFDELFLLKKKFTFNKGLKADENEQDN